MNYSEAIDYIQSFPDMERGTPGSRGLTMSLDSMRSLLNRLDNPQNGRRTVHITGSKGKSSTSRMIASILQKSGLRTALFTSPHLQSYTERIEFGMQPISEELFAQAVTEMQPQIEEEGRVGSGPLSTFGILTAVFFYTCRQQKPEIEWQIVEVGLGGRYDATNVFEKKDLVIVTPISLEHIEVLGASQTEIAGNKGAIVTDGCSTGLSPQKDASVRSVISRQCHQVGANLIDVGSRSYNLKILSQTVDGQSFVLTGPSGALEAHMPILGAHQASNAAAAIVAAQILKQTEPKVTDQTILQGLSGLKIDGRFEILAHGTETSPFVVVDGAHNHESAAALAKTLKELFPDRKITFVIGLNNDKNANAIWRELHPLSKRVITTRSRSLRALDPRALAEAVDFQIERSALVTDSVAEAVAQALQEAQPGDVICITGSLYVAAEAREFMKVPASRSTT